MPTTEALPKPDTGAIPQGALDESFSEIEGLDDTKPTEPEKPKPAAKVEPEKKPEPPKKPEPTDEFSEPDQPTPPEKKAEKPPDKPIKIPELRVAFEKAKSRISELEAQIEQAKTATPTADPEKPKLQSQVQERDQKIEALERRIAEQEKVIQFADYQSSDEYKSKYETPYTDAFKRALSDFEQLTVTITDSDGNQTARKATVNDLLALQNMPLGEVDALAEGMFGKSAPRVIRHVEHLRDLAEAKNAALTNAQKAAQEKRTQLTEQAKVESEKRVQLWNDTNKKLAEKFPQWYAQIEGDKEGNEILARDQSLVDKAFSGAPMPLETRVNLDANIRNRAAGFGRLALLYKRAQAEIKALKETVKQYEGSEPPAGDTKKGEKPAKYANWLDEAGAEIEALNK